MNAKQLTSQKLGSPDARMIVAMLAREYRRVNKTALKYSSISRVIEYSYLQAKQLLGELE